MKLINKIAKRIGLVPYTIEDVISEVRKTGVEKVLITARTIKYSADENRHYYGQYIPLAIIAKRKIRVGNPIDVNFNPVDGCPGPMDLRFRIIERRQIKTEEILMDYVKTLQNSGISATYKDFDRTY